MSITVREFTPKESAGASSDLPSAGDIFAVGADMLLIAYDGASPKARCSLWWQSSPPLYEKKAGYIGHFQADSPDAAVQLLNHSAKVLRSQGCVMAIGPIDGSTWRTYRLVVETGVEPPFFLEPNTPGVYPGYFRTAHFTELASYFSAIASNLCKKDPLVERARKRLAEEGVMIREFKMSAFEEELRSIYSISTLSFSNNFLYTSIAEPDFLQMYSKLKSYVDPKLSLIAQRGSEEIGFLFAIPDILRPERDTLIIKTTAVLPGFRNGGLGNVLVAECQERAHKLGFRRAIHALMHESNSSRNLSARYAVPFRRYALFAREI
jgi:hypothetical protein